MRITAMMVVLGLVGCDALQPTEIEAILVDPDATADSADSGDTTPPVIDPKNDDDDDTQPPSDTEDSVPPADNTAPVASAGPDQVDVLPGTTVELDGTASADADGDPLDYQWTLLQTPKGSATQLGNATKPVAFFFADIDGTYVAELRVSDGIDDDADTVMVTVVRDNLPPFADAGVNQSVSVGATVTLSGSGSYDPDGSIAAYDWELISKPTTSSTGLAGVSGASTQQLYTDVAGDYVVSLTVTDDLGLPSNQAIVTVTATADDSSDDCFSCSASDQAQLRRQWTMGRAGTSVALLGLPILVALFGARRRDD